MRAIEIQRILCPTDFSVFAERALALAIPVARWYHSAITILHVRPPLPAVVSGGGTVVHRSAGPRASSAPDACLQTFARPAHKAGVQVETLVRDGDATREILACATRLASDLLVMGTHGRSGFERWVLGSVAEKVLRKAACPVLTIGPGNETGVHSWDPILCAVDFSASSRAALDYALALTRVARVRLEVLHVVESMPPFQPHPEIDIAAYRRWLIDEAYRALHELIPDDARERMVVGENVTFGKAYAEILRVARDAGSGLVVLGVRGRGAVDLALFGSTTNQVVRACASPVLTVREG
jgi:nucleotide-binding universal stress UspA family protein